MFEKPPAIFCILTDKRKVHGCSNKCKKDIIVQAELKCSLQCREEKLTITARKQLPVCRRAVPRLMRLNSFG